MTCYVYIEFSVPSNTTLTEDVCALNLLCAPYVQDADISCVRMRLFWTKKLEHLVRNYNDTLRFRGSIVRLRPTEEFDVYSLKRSVVCYVEPPGIDELVGLHD